MRGHIGRWAVASSLPSVGELVTLAGTVRYLPSAMRADHAPRLTAVVAPDAGVCAASSDVPVLLVHGYLGTPSCWSPVVGRLHDAGFRHVFTFGYNSLAGTIPGVAAQVLQAAHATMAATGQDQVHLVGHSLGGLVTRYAVQHLGLSRDALSVVTIATPHRGSPLAYVAPGPAGAQMRPHSALLDHLPPMAQTPGVGWLVVDSDHDVVAPRADHQGVQYRVVASSGHQSILRSAELGWTVVRHLAATERGLLPTGPTSQDLGSVA